MPRNLTLTDGSSKLLGHREQEQKGLKNVLNSRLFKQKISFQSENKILLDLQLSLVDNVSEFTNFRMHHNCKQIVREATSPRPALSPENLEKRSPETSVLLHCFSKVTHFLQVFRHFLTKKNRRNRSSKVSRRSKSHRLSTINASTF